MIECFYRDELVQPWQLNPRQLISWWEMQQFSARAFFWIGYALERITGDCYMASSVLDPNAPLYDLSKKIDSKVAEKLRDSLAEIKKHSKAIGLSISEATATDLLNEVSEQQKIINYQSVVTQLKCLRKIIEIEMKDKAFFYISPERGRFWPKYDQPLFGTEVTQAFPSADFEIHQAGVCLAIGLGTASVFHQMRVLERGLMVLGSTFSVLVEHRNWEQVIQDIEKKIRGMHDDPAWKSLPDWKEKRESYAQIASHFGVLKDAWRNYTMHARGKYTEDEAEMVFLNVRDFMQKLAGLGLKEIHE
jgi:hypothetical protein